MERREQIRFVTVSLQTRIRGLAINRDRAPEPHEEKAVKSFKRKLLCDRPVNSPRNHPAPLFLELPYLVS